MGVGFLPYRYKHRPKKSKSRRPDIKKVLKRNILVLIGVPLVLIIGIIVADIYLPATPYTLADKIITGLSTVGYKQVLIDAAIIENQGVVTLTSECYVITAYVEKYQVSSILMGINDVLPPRPNAHDIAADAFDTLGIEVLMVKVTEVRDNSFHGKLILRKGNRIANLDARPSDATAIAVRTDAPIYVKGDLLEEHGAYVC